MCSDNCLCNSLSYFCLYLFDRVYGVKFTAFYLHGSDLCIVLTVIRKEETSSHAHDLFNLLEEMREEFCSKQPALLGYFGLVE